MDPFELEIKKVFLDFVDNGLFFHPNFQHSPEAVTLQTIKEYFDLHRFTMTGMIRHYVQAKYLIGV